MTIAGLNDVFEADRLARQVGADRAAQECVVMEDADLAQIARVVTDDHVLADVGRKRQVEITEPKKCTPSRCTRRERASVSNSRSSCSSDSGSRGRNPSDSQRTCGAAPVSL
jgi:hypothetical protein